MCKIPGFGLIDISRGLARFPSLGYALIYLTMIPVFAGVYNLYSTEFYHSTAQYEREMVSLKLQLSGILKNDIADNAVKIHQQSKDDDYADVQDSFFNVSITSITAQNITFHITYPARIHSKTNNLLRKCEGDLVLETNEAIDPSVLFKSNVPLHEIKVLSHFRNRRYLYLIFDSGMKFDGTPSGQQYNSGGDSIEKIISMTTKPGENVPSNTTTPFSIETQYYMETSENFTHGLQPYLNALNGFPSDVAGSYWRLFYFSAVTITTVGYGDILPLTPWTRGLVALEAILGIVLIGLFLNSLSREGNPKQGK